jgi:hypothetical protein
MPEALEKWPVAVIGKLLPRHLEIIDKIDTIWKDSLKARAPGRVSVRGGWRDEAPVGRLACSRGVHLNKALQCWASGLHSSCQEKHSKGESRCEGSRFEKIRRKKYEGKNTNIRLIVYQQLGAGALERRMSNAGIVIRRKHLPHGLHVSHCCILASY